MSRAKCWLTMKNRVETFADRPRVRLAMRCAATGLPFVALAVFCKDALDRDLLLILDNAFPDDCDEVPAPRTFLRRFFAPRQPGRCFLWHSIHWACPHCGASRDAVTPARIFVGRPQAWVCHCENTNTERWYRRLLRRHPRIDLEWRTEELVDYPWGHHSHEPGRWGASRCSCWHSKQRRHYVEAYLG